MRFSKAFSIGVVLLMVLSVLLSACAGAQPTPAPTSAPQATKPAEPAKATAPAKPAATVGADVKPAAKSASGEPIKIGAIFPFTGRYAPMGDPMKKSAEMLVEQINSSGGIAGRPVQLILYDDEGDQAKSLQMADKLISQDKVVAIVGPIPTANAQAVTEVAERNKVPILYSNPTASIWNGKKYVFQINHDDAMQAEAVINYLDKQKGVKSIAILHDANPYGTFGQGVAKAAAEKRGIKVTTIEKYAGEDRDVTPQLTKIKNSGAEAMVIWGVNPVPGIAVKQLRQLGSNIPVAGSDAFYSPVFIETAGEASEGTSSVTALNTDKPDAEQAALLNLYKSKYNAVPPPFAAFAWDGINIFKAAIEKSGGKTDADSIVQGMYGIAGFKGTMGKRSFTDKNHNGLSADSLSVAQVKGGKWVILPN